VGVRSVRTVWGTALALAVTAIASSCGHDTIELARTSDEQTQPDGGAASSDAGNAVPPDAGSCDAYCRTLGGVCSPEQRCVQCNTSDDCNTGPVPLLRACDPATHACVVCNTNDDCDPWNGIPGVVFLCNTEVRRCGLACPPAPLDCPLPFGCNVERGLCNECNVDADCERYPLVKKCLDGACVGCRSEGDCGDGYCEPALLQCVECVNSLDCLAGEACRLDTHVCVRSP